MDLPVNDAYSRRRRYRRNSKLGDYYYPLERKKSFLESLTSKFKKLRFGSDKYDDDDYCKNNIIIYYYIFIIKDIYNTIRY